MNPRPTLFLFLLIFICCQVTLGQEPSVDQASQIQDRTNQDVENLRTLQAEIAKTLKSIDGPSEMDVRADAAGARQIALRLQRNLVTSKLAGGMEKQLEPASDSPRDTLRLLYTLLTDLIEAPDNARQIDALIEFTEPVQLEFRKDHPLAIWMLMDLLLTADMENTVEVVEPRVIKLAQKRCVDFIDNGTTFSALRAVGASEPLIKEIDTCLSPESRAVILNRVAATPEDVQTTANAVILGDVVRFLFRKKDLAGRRRFIETGREFLRRFGEDSYSVEFVSWLRFNIPKVQKRVDEMAAAK